MGFRDGDSADMLRRCHSKTNHEFRAPTSAATKMNAISNHPFRLCHTLRWIGLRWCCFTFVAATSLGCAPTVQRVPPPKQAKSPRVQDDALVQFSLISALAAGDYADGAPLRNVLAAGDFGVGTFDNLDGELILLDGQMFQALADGTTRPANRDGNTPFAAVTFFHEDGRLEKLSAATLADLEAELNDKLPRRNVPYAVRVDGRFPQLTLRSVPAQQRPFQPLVEVVKHQTTQQLHDLRGTLIGLRCPAWVGTLNVAGYHWHFLSDDRQIGGHVLACELRDGLVRYDECDSLVIHLGNSREFDAFQVDQVDDQDIHRIERLRTP